MPFKFVNWFFDQKHQRSKLGKLAKRCVKDDNFPTHPNLFQEVLEYFESNEFKLSDIEILLEAWEEFRQLGKIKVVSLNQLRSKYSGPYFQ